MRLLGYRSRGWRKVGENKERQGVYLGIGEAMEERLGVLRGGVWNILSDSGI